MQPLEAIGVDGVIMFSGVLTPLPRAPTLTYTQSKSQLSADGHGLRALDPGEIHALKK
jgi:hypothetical protein